MREGQHLLMPVMIASVRQTVARRWQAGPLVAFVGASNTLLASGTATILLGLIATVFSARKRAGQQRRGG